MERWYLSVEVISWFDLIWDICMEKKWIEVDGKNFWKKRMFVITMHNILLKFKKEKKENDETELSY